MDTDQICLGYLIEELGDPLIEVVVAGLNTGGTTNRADAQPFARLRCRATLAAAEEAMALGAGGGVFIGGKGPVVTLPLAGMVIFSPQEGQSICVPAPD